MKIKKLDIGASEIEYIEAFNELVDTINDHKRQLNNHLCRLLALEDHEEEPEDEPLKETFVSIDEALKMGKQDHKIRSTNERLRVELETCYRLILHWQNQLEGCSPNTIGATLYKQMDEQTDYLRQFLTKGGKDAE